MIDDALEHFKTAYGTAPSVIAHAPGRIEFVGNHTDYNGGDVLGVAVKQGITCALSFRDDRQIHGISSGGGPTFEYSLDDLETRSKGVHWASYPLGVLWAIEGQGVKLKYGINLSFTSEVPTGAGMSSSAALELSTAYAVLSGLNHDFSRKDIVRICRYAENNYVGLPCGILDQGVSGFGKEDQLVFIDCKTESFSNVPIPHGTHFWIFNSDTKHSLIDSLYSERFTECGEGFEVAKSLRPGLEHLVDFPVADLKDLSGHLGGKAYKRVSHILNENQQVKDVVRLLNQKEVDLKQTGKFLFDSHASSRDLFENSTNELDFLVAELKENDKVYGARLTGGGFGGAVMAWTSSSFDKSDANSICRQYEQRFGHAPRVLHCESGDGAQVLWKA